MAATRLDINSASKEELSSLPAVDEKRAEILVRQRPFHSWREVEALPGFGERLVEAIQEEGGYLTGQGEEPEYL